MRKTIKFSNLTWKIIKYTEKVVYFWVKNIEKN